MKLLSISAVTLGLLIGSAQATMPEPRAEMKTEVVHYTLNGTEFEGYAAHLTAGAAHKPVVVIVHDWNGPDDYEFGRARQLAELGYIGFVADIYGKGVRPKNAQENGAEAQKYYKNPGEYRARLARAVEVASALPAADKNKVAAIGYCFGGTGVLELARSGANLRGVVSFHGGLSALGAVDKIKAEILVLHGADDPMVPNAQVTAFEKEMTDAKARFAIVKFPGAVHAFTVPSAGNDNSRGAAYNKDADLKSWELMRAFLARLFKA